MFTFLLQSLKWTFIYLLYSATLLLGYFWIKFSVFDFLMSSYCLRIKFPFIIIAFPCKCMYNSWQVWFVGIWKSRRCSNKVIVRKGTSSDGSDWLHEYECYLYHLKRSAKISCVRISATRFSSVCRRVLWPGEKRHIQFIIFISYSDISEKLISQG